MGSAGTREPATSRTVHTISDANILRLRRRAEGYQGAIATMTKFRDKVLVEVEGQGQLYIVGILNNGHGKSLMVAAGDGGDPIPVGAAKLKNKKLWKEWTGEDLPEPMKQESQAQ